MTRAFLINTTCHIEDHFLKTAVHMKTALIGCGRIGCLLENDPLRYKPCTHYGGAHSAGLQITHACDINRSRLALFSKIAAIPRDDQYDDYADLLRHDRPELAIIATWTETHEQIAIEAARNGVHVIILEKPMASTLKACQHIIDECAAQGTTIILNHERRFDNRYRKVKELLARGKIGDIKTVHASILTAGYTEKTDLAEGGGPLLHDGTHLVDMIRFLFGEIIFVEGEFQRQGRSSGFEDRACAWLKTEEGIDVFLEAGGLRKYFIFELEISGTEGKIIIGNGYQKLFMRRSSRLYTGFHDIVETPFPAIKKNNCFKDIYLEARKALKGKSSISSSGADGYKAIEVIHAIYLSSYNGKKRLHLPIDPSIVNLKKIFNIK